MVFIVHCFYCTIRLIFFKWTDIYGMVVARQNEFGGHVSLAVTARTQLGGKISRSGKFAGSLVGQMAGRTNAGLGRGLALQILFIGCREQQIVFAVSQMLFSGVTCQAIR